MEEWQKTLSKILAKEPYEITAFEAAFLKARRLYLSKKQKEKFSNVFGETKKSKKSKK